MRPRRRVAMIAVGIVLAGLALVIKLASLQLVQADTWRGEREKNVLGVEWLAAERGRIEDSRGRVLAQDLTSFTLIFNYRDFRRGNLVGLLVHLDRLVRELRRELPGIGGTSLVAGPPLDLTADAAQLREATAGLLALPAAWLHAGGPVHRRLRTVLRFYVFGCISAALASEGQPPPSGGRLGLAFDRGNDEPPAGDLASVIPTFLPDSDAARLSERLATAATMALAALDELAAQLGTDLPLRGRGRQTKAGWVAERGPLRTWLAVLDAWIDEQASPEREKKRQERREQDPKTPTRLARILTFLSDTLRPAADDGLEAALERRFRAENNFFELVSPVGFENVVALVLTRPQLFAGFTTGQETRRDHPRRDASGRPYPLLGIVREVEPERDDKTKAIERRPTWQLDEAVDVRSRLDFEDREWRERLEKARQSGRVTDRRGSDGVEANLNGILAGDLGLRQREHDRRGVERSSPRHLEARRGQDVRLTIDADLQDLAVRALESVAASELTVDVVHASLALIDACSGDILAMAWLPATSPAGDGTLLPFRINTTASHFYVPYPGSVIKPFVAYEGLVRGLAQAGDFEPCTRRWPANAHRDGITCDCRWTGHPPAVVPALTYSCNSFFAQLGVRMGDEAVDAALRRFRCLGELEDGDHVRGLSVSTPGRVPREARPLRQRAIGYGYRIAPLTLARAYAGLGTGRLPALRYLAAIGGQATEASAAVDLDLDAAAIAMVREGLLRAVRGGGTARDVGLDAFGVAAKTGTAEVAVRKLNNAWLAGYLPSEAPRLAFACVFWGVPHGVHGAEVAGKAVVALLCGMHDSPELRALYLTRGAR